LAVTALAALLSPGCSTTSPAVNTPGLAITASPTSVQVGATSAVQATVTLDGVAQVAQTVAFTSSNVSVAALSAASAVTNAAGQAQVTATALAPGSTVVTAAWSSRTATVTLTVTAPPATERVLFTRAASEFHVVNNSPGSAVSTAPLGGDRIPFGVQRGGALVFLTDLDGMDAVVRDLGTGTETAFTPGEVAPMSLSFVEPYIASIASAGDRVLWLRDAGGGTVAIVRANLNGSGELALFSADGADTPISVSISPDDTQVAFVTLGGAVRTIALAGGVPVTLNLGASLATQCVDWLSNSELAAGVGNHEGSGFPGIIRIPTNGDPASSIFSDGGAGLRSVPQALAVDSNHNIVYDENDASLSQRDIYRLDAPGYVSRVGLVTAADDDVRPGVVRY
jgi:hypothetical protein